MTEASQEVQNPAYSVAVFFHIFNSTILDSTNIFLVFLHFIRIKWKTKPTLRLKIEKK